jgi:hypothetical protein
VSIFFRFPPWLRSLLSAVKVISRLLCWIRPTSTALKNPPTTPSSSDLSPGAHSALRCCESKTTKRSRRQRTVDKPFILGPLSLPHGFMTISLTGVHRPGPPSHVDSLSNRAQSTAMLPSSAVQHPNPRKSSALICLRRKRRPLPRSSLGS